MPVKGIKNSVQNDETFTALHITAVVICVGQGEKQQAVILS